MPDAPVVPLKTAERLYFCPCCGSNNTRVASVKQMVDPDDASSTWKSVSIWCDNCSDPIHIEVEVSNDFELSNDYNIMAPLVRRLGKL